MIPFWERLALKKFGICTRRAKTFFIRLFARARGLIDTIDTRISEQAAEGSPQTCGSLLLSRRPDFRLTSSLHMYK